MRKIFPSILPNWDHTPRSGKRGVIFEGSTPKLFMKHAEMVIDAVKSKPSSKQIIFLKHGMNGEKVITWSPICKMAKNIFGL